MTSASLPDLASSIVIDVVPRLPLHPAFEVDTATTSCAVHTAISFVVSVSTATAITSLLALNVRHNQLVSALELSKDDLLTWGCDQDVQRLGHCDSMHLRHFRGVSNGVRVCAYAEHIRVIPVAIRHIWSRSCSIHRYYHFRFDTRHIQVPPQCIRLAPNAIRHISAAFRISSTQPSGSTPAVSSASFNSLGQSVNAGNTIDALNAAIDSFVSHLKLSSLPLEHTIHSPSSGSPYALGMFAFAFSLH
ncbi:hypothetical protein SCLCIDRAFT_29102 [Scleroderma citrinum Foug A]|uniref:Uncharacterized protein n=1 Tax=Scleroderma citrinum Foug A TaxID=1036808 RepID=A0A0C3D8G4_9AGAM|nr:hypothetical protein SCLCIDRAFT_29102 [Scleroderma citrinum Foug A]